MLGSGSDSGSRRGLPGAARGDPDRCWAPARTRGRVGACRVPPAATLIDLGVGLGVASGNKPVEVCRVDRSPWSGNDGERRQGAAMAEGAVARVGRWCFRRRWLVMVAW